MTLALAPKLIPMRILKPIIFAIESARARAIVAMMLIRDENAIAPRLPSQWFCKGSAVKTLLRINISTHGNRTCTDFDSLTYRTPAASGITAANTPTIQKSLPAGSKFHSFMIERAGEVRD